jgi:hypothetical protein
MQATHSALASMLSSMTGESATLVKDIGVAVRAMQFQDRISQQIAHVVHDLETLHSKIHAQRCEGAVSAAGHEGFSAFTMHEERVIAGAAEEESAPGDIELF